MSQKVISQLLVVFPYINSFEVYGDVECVEEDSIQVKSEQLTKFVNYKGELSPLIIPITKKGIQNLTCFSNFFI